jgi:glucose-like phosphotransferase system IIB component
MDNENNNFINQMEETPMPHTIKLAAKILELAGGPENIVTAAHCMTRLRLTLIDHVQADIDQLKQAPGVLGGVESSGQLQLILGPGVVNKVAACFNEMSSGHENTQGAARLNEGFRKEQTKISLGEVKDGQAARDDKTSAKLAMNASVAKVFR